MQYLTSDFTRNDVMAQSSNNVSCPVISNGISNQFDAKTWVIMWILSCVHNDLSVSNRFRMHHTSDVLDCFAVSNHCLDIASGQETGIDVHILYIFIVGDPNISGKPFYFACMQFTLCWQIFSISCWIFIILVLFLWFFILLMYLHWVTTWAFVGL